MARAWLFGYDGAHEAHIGGGENVGATLAEMDVVRSVTALGTWSGRAAGFTAARPRGEYLAVVLQRDDEPFSAPPSIDAGDTPSRFSRRSHRP